VRSGPPPRQPHDFAELVRSALHAAADQVEPRPDGLDRIRAAIRSGSPAITAPRRRKSNRKHWWQNWDLHQVMLRPALAFVCAVFAAGVAAAVPPLRQAIVQLSSSVLTGHTTGGSTGGGAVAGSGAPSPTGAPAASPAKMNQKIKKEKFQEKE